MLAPLTVDYNGDFSVIPIAKEPDLCSAGLEVSGQLI